MEEYCFLLNSQPKEVKIKIIKLEKTIKKKINIQWSIKFNKRGFVIFIQVFIPYLSFFLICVQVCVLVNCQIWHTFKRNWFIYCFSKENSEKGKVKYEIII